MSRVRSVADWLSVRDPGWGRGQMGWRTLVGLVAGLAVGYVVAPALGLPALLGLVFGGLLGLLTGLIAAGAPAGELARHLAWYLRPSLDASGRLPGHGARPWEAPPRLRLAVAVRLVPDRRSGRGSILARNELAVAEGRGTGDDDGQRPRLAR